MLEVSGRLRNCGYGRVSVALGPRGKRHLGERGGSILRSRRRHRYPACSKASDSRWGWYPSRSHRRTWLQGAARGPGSVTLNTV